MPKYKVPLKSRKDGAIYKAKIAVKYQPYGKGRIARIDLSFPVIEIESESEGLAYKELCKTFRPEDTRKIDGKGFLSMCEVGAPARVYSFCEKHTQPYCYQEGRQDIGCDTCEVEQAQCEFERQLIIAIAVILGCSEDDVDNDKAEAVLEGFGRYEEGHFEGYKKRQKAAIKKVAVALGRSEEDAHKLLENLLLLDSPPYLAVPCWLWRAK